MLYGNAQISGKEVVMEENDVIVSKTDLAGKITYANRTFFHYAGYNEQEILNKPHNIIRHPQMPRCVFALLWQEISSGREIFAYVNNRAKNGDNYWVLAHVTPGYDQNGNIVEYHSNRRCPNRQTLETHIMPLYKDLLAIEKSYESPKDGLQAGLDKISTLLKEKGMGFNELMFALGM